MPGRAPRRRTGEWSGRLHQGGGVHAGVELGEGAAAAAAGLPTRAGEGGDDLPRIVEQIETDAEVGRARAAHLHDEAGAVPGRVSRRLATVVRAEAVGR